ncbi:MAG TPA: hypothetical protein PK961_00295 [bacterium]|nr:hypothetical protein [bacterium]
MRCACCRRTIQPTVHTQSAVRVDGYRLHTGKVKLVENSTGHNKDRAVYLQLYDALDGYVCVDCFAKQNVNKLWLHGFPTNEELEALRP